MLIVNKYIKEYITCLLPVFSKGGLKRVQIGQDESDKIQERFAGAPVRKLIWHRFKHIYLNIKI